MQSIKTHKKAKELRMLAAIERINVCLNMNRPYPNSIFHLDETVF